jgi:6-phosphofructokinase
LERVIEVFKTHDVGYFFYIGGNDSMDTAHKIARLAHERGLELVATGVPKTIDNDVGDAEFKLIDHTPGYGSVARYWALNVQNWPTWSTIHCGNGGGPLSSSARDSTWERSASARTLSATPRSPPA